MHYAGIIKNDVVNGEDMKIIRFLNTINVVKFIDVDWSDEEWDYLRRKPRLNQDI